MESKIFVSEKFFLDGKRFLKFSSIHDDTFEWTFIGSFMEYLF